MAPLHSTPRFTQIQSDVDKVEGFLLSVNIAVWDVFLEYQETHHIVGHLGEIGVYKGKSAIILAHHQQSGEQLWLVDFSDFIEEAKRNIDPLTTHEVRYLKQKSVTLHRSPALLPHRRSFRWIHIDGEHTGQAVASDLAIAHQLLADEGIICIDDFFNPAYAQVTAATFACLQTNRFDLTIFACGQNKGYLARPTYARHYMQMIRSSLGAGLRERGFAEFTLFKTSPVDDFNCWGIGQRFRDRDYYGLDSNPDEFC
jgi:predicted O-methyltransferase YrrM